MIAQSMVLKEIGKKSLEGEMEMKIYNRIYNNLKKQKMPSIFDNYQFKEDFKIELVKIICYFYLLKIEGQKCGEYLLIKTENTKLISNEVHQLYYLNKNTMPWIEMFLITKVKFEGIAIIGLNAFISILTFPSIIILLILFWKNINKKVTMLRVNLKREGNKVSMVFNTNTSPMPLQQNQLVNKGQINQPLTIRVSMGNDPSTSENQLLLTSSKVVDLKAVNAKKICDQVGELKKALNTFRYLEKDEDKYKLFILHWFNQIQAIFQNALNGKLSQQAEALVQPELQAKNNRFPLPDQNTKPILFINSEPSELITNKEIQNLKLEVQTYQKDSIQAVETIESIMKMVAVVEEKLEAERKQKKSILEIVTTYSDKLESILEKISAKYQKEKKITRLEREIQLILTRIKFKALNDINGYTCTVQ